MISVTRMKCLTSFKVSVFIATMTEVKSFYTMFSPYWHLMTIDRAFAINHLFIRISLNICPHLPYKSPKIRHRIIYRNISLSFRWNSVTITSSCTSFFHLDNICLWCKWAFAITVSLESILSPTDQIEVYGWKHH